MMLAERPGGGGGAGSGGGGAEGPSVGNYKGVMLCNRPFAGPTGAMRWRADNGWGVATNAAPFPRRRPARPVKWGLEAPAAVWRPRRAQAAGRPALGQGRRGTWLLRARFAPSPAPSDPAPAPVASPGSVHPRGAAKTRRKPQRNPALVRHRKWLHNLQKERARMLEEMKEKQQEREARLEKVRHPLSRR